MDLEDSASDDSDFCPEKHEDSNSEISEPGEDDPAVSEDESETKKSKKTRKVSKRRKSKAASPKVEKERAETVIDPEEEKRKADAIWADFLGGTESHLESKEGGKSAASTSLKPSIKPEPTKPNIPAKVAAASEIFEFAGETVKIPAKETEKPSTTAPLASTRLGTPGVKRAGGLSSVLNQLTKKNKLSVLEKTKLDWDGFKSEEGIGEELQTHNRGREG